MIQDIGSGTCGQSADKENYTMYPIQNYFCVLVEFQIRCAFLVILSAVSVDRQIVS